jgi:putative transposase
MDDTEGLADGQLVELIQTIQDELPGYGDRRVAHELLRYGHVVNHKRVARLTKAHNLSVTARRRFVRTTNSNHDSRNTRATHTGEHCGRPAFAAQ